MPAPAPSLTARYVVAGPPTHGVVVHAMRLAASSATLCGAVARVPSASGREPSGLGDAVPAGAAALVHVTDRLFGGSPEEAAATLHALASRATLAVSLHDVPQLAEGDAWYRRRRSTYAECARLATRLIVASHYEADLLCACLDDAPERAAVARRTTVIPLPVERRQSRSLAPHDRDPDVGAEVSVLGFLYPGKGLEDAIDVASSLRHPGREVAVTNYGAPADGHADYAEWLTRYAAEAGVRFRVTGYLSDEAFATSLVQAGVPLAPHRHISASASVSSWIEAGRRPILRRSPYAAELAARLPGAVTVADDVATAVGQAMDDPPSTWLESDVEVGPSWAAAAEAHADVLRQIA